MFKDADSTWAFFTWSNASGIIRSKLDRVLVSNTWLQRELECRANFMARGIFSDHSPVIVYMFKDLPTYPKPFKFHNMWTKHPEFKKIT